MEEKIIRKFKWISIKTVDSQEAVLFSRLFYLNDLPAKVHNNKIYTPMMYRDLIEGIIRDHQSNTLSKSYYRKFNRHKKLVKPDTGLYFKREWLKIIGPIILVGLLLIFIRFIFAFNII